VVVLCFRTGNMRRAEDHRKVPAGGHQQRELVGDVLLLANQLLDHLELGQRVGGRAAGGAGEPGEQLELAGHGGGRAGGADAVEAAAGPDQGG
jgi:hypothetical protein